MSKISQKTVYHGQFILAMIMFILLTMAVGVSSSKSSIVVNRLTFQVETGNYLRSNSLVPETASPLALPEGILVLSSRKELKLFDYYGKAQKGFELDFAPTATPAVADGKVYVGGKDGKFHCLDLETGREIWANDLKSIEFSQPALAGRLVIFQTASDRIIALDTATGEWRWEYQHLRGEDLAVAGMCPPLVVDDVVYLGLSAGYIMAMEAESGKPVWKVRPFTGAKFMDVDAAMSADAEYLFATSVGGGAVGLSRRTGKVVWRTSAGGLGGLHLAEGILYLAYEEPAVVAFESSTGKLLWNTRLKEKGIRFSDTPSAPVVVKGIVSVIDRNGRIFSLSAADGKVIERNRAFSRTADGLVGLPDGSGFLVLDNQGVVRVWQVVGR